MTLFNKLPEEEKFKVLMMGSAYYLPKIESRLLKAREKTENFERKYKCSFIGFEKKLPSKAGHKLHEDWVEWSYWQEVLKQYPSYLSVLKTLADSKNERSKSF